MPGPARVLDSWAVLALLQDEPAAEEVKGIFLEAQQSGRELLISSINMGEVWYETARRRSKEEADRTTEDLRSSGLQVVDADWELTRVAAGFKARFRLAYADCFAAALAWLRGAHVVTGDPEFRQLQKEVKIRWL